MSFSFLGLVRPHPDVDGHLEVSHTTYDNTKRDRAPRRFVAAVPEDASREEVAAAFGEVARLSFLASMESR